MSEVEKAVAEALRQPCPDGCTYRAARGARVALGDCAVHLAPRVAEALRVAVESPAPERLTQRFDAALKALRGEAP